MLAAHIERCLKDEKGEWLPTSEKLLQRAGGAKDVPASSALLEISEKLIEVFRAEDEENPQRDDKDLKKDIVYRLGMRAGISMVLGIPDATRQIINAKQRGG